MIYFPVSGNTISKEIRQMVLSSENMFDVFDFAVFMISGHSYRRFFRVVNTEQAPSTKTAEMASLVLFT